MTIEAPAREVFAEVLRLERELDAAVGIICGLVARLDNAQTIMQWQDAVRLAAQRDAEHWQIEFSLTQEELDALKDEMRRYAADRIAS